MILLLLVIFYCSKILSIEYQPRTKMTRTLLLLVALCFSIETYALFTPNEYNIWHYQEGVLYGATQSEASEPVLVSIAGPGTEWANIVISMTKHEPCQMPDEEINLLINNDIFTFWQRCVQAGEDSLVSYVLEDSQAVNQMYTHLKSGFTVVIDGRIKLWAANIAHPTR